MAKRALLTGATGFVGSNLARRLLEEGHEVHLLVREGYSSWRIDDIKDRVRIHVVSLADAGLLNKTVANVKPEWIFHLAAHGTYPAQTDPDAILQTNVTDAMTFIEACLKTGFESFVNTGSSSEYGFKDHPPDESESTEPNSFYGLTKVSTTLFCRYVAQNEKVYMPTLRPYFVYGPYEEPTQLIPTLIASGLNGKLPPLGDPEASNDYVYIDDVVEAYVLAASKKSSEPGAVYNVGTGHPTTLRKIVDLIKKIFGIAGETQWNTLPDRPWDTKHCVANIGKISRDLCWVPRVDLEKGFKMTVEWFKNHPGIVPTVMTR